MNKIMTPEERTNKGASKVSHYKWEMVDQPGIFMLIPKAELLVDAAYQRTAADDKLFRIAREWSWVACGCLTVAMRDGAFFVMDGQHRKLAADKRSDIAELPCMVFETQGQKQEAEGFFRANINRKPVSALGQYKALLIAQDQTAAKIEAFASAIGRRVADFSEPNTLTCVASMRRCIEKNEAAMRRIWPVVGAVFAGKKMHNDVIEGLFYIEHMATAGQSISAEPWRSRIVKLGLDGLLAAIARSRAFYNRGGPQVSGLGIVQAANARVRNAPLVLREGKAP